MREAHAKYLSVRCISTNKIACIANDGVQMFAPPKSSVFSLFSKNKVSVPQSLRCNFSDVQERVVGGKVEIAEQF